MEGPHPQAVACGTGTTWNRTCSLLKLHMHIPAPQDPEASFQLLLSSLRASWTLSISRFGLLVNVRNSGPETTHIFLEELKNGENFKRILFSYMLSCHILSHEKPRVFNNRRFFLGIFFFPLSKTIFKYVIAAQKQKNKPAHSAMMALHLPEENENKTIDEAVSSPVEPRRERCWVLSS